LLSPSLWYRQLFYLSKEVIVELLTETQKKTKHPILVIGMDPIPVIGMESESTSCKKDRASRIAESAYYKAETRNFEPGREMEDWLEAEAEEGEE